MGLTHKILEIIFKSGLIDIIIISSLTIVMWTKIAKKCQVEYCQFDLAGVRNSYVEKYAGSINTPYSEIAI